VQVLENVRSDGSLDFSSPDGRLTNPGHAIEAGWFLLEFAVRTGDATLRTHALHIIERNFEWGWDSEGGVGAGGLLYFKDAEGFSPTQLEWPM
jgi:N-acylglucosamine 2-epimerase